MAILRIEQMLQDMGNQGQDLYGVRQITHNINQDALIVFIWFGATTISDQKPWEINVS